MPTLRVSDADTLGYADVGQGPVIVLVHGSPGTSRAWEPVAGRLAARFRLIMPDLPGYGATPRPPGDGGGDSAYAIGLLEALVAKIGAPAVLAGHSYGGGVALLTALRGRATPRALALFEPVAVPVLAAVGETEAFAAVRAMVERYVAAFEAGDREAVGIMVDYWFGAGAFHRMPGPMREFLIARTADNLRDVRATLRDAYPLAGLRGLGMPVLCAYGSRSPEVMVRIVEAIAAQAPRGMIRRLEQANHAMTATHAEMVADLIAELADGSA
jgi:pimeloyl-ACP methyl ester carboxylesterase